MLSAVGVESLRSVPGPTDHRRHDPAQDMFATGLDKDSVSGGANPKKAYAHAKEKSLQEANLTCSDISAWGAFAPKLPQSGVAKIAALKKFPNSTIKHKYNFQGRLTGNEAEVKRRAWVLPFAKNNFGDGDMLVLRKVSCA